ncbi:MAG: 50S ribosomal protein L6 [Deltaproteobacteria bacterium]|nr:50S ribosomal protein L6 [Candidatus Zymogenaceae bacterium]
MSRIGKKPIEIPSGVTVEVTGDVVKVSGPKGSLSQSFSNGVSIDVTDAHIEVKSADGSRKARSFQGLYRALIANMVQGVSEGISKTLEINGLGYRAEVEGNNLTLNVGYSHPVKYELPEGISASVDKNTVITVSGIDKQLVGQVASEIRSIRKPEPYKGKGIRYLNEHIKRKAGKTGV